MIESLRRWREGLLALIPAFSPRRRCGVVDVFVNHGWIWSAVERPQNMSHLRSSTFFWVWFYKYVAPLEL